MKKLLTHGLDKMELASLEVLGHKALVIDKKNAGAKIGEILEGEKKPTEKELPEEKVIIFSGYEDEEVQELVSKFRTIFSVRPILAVVTEHSIGWPFDYLLTEHLIKDRDANRENRRKYLEEMERENKKLQEENNKER